MSVDGKPDYRMFDATDAVQPLLPLLESNYGASEISSSDYLEWEYQRNPAGPPVIAIAESPEREIVGQYVVIPVEYSIDGKSVKGSLSLNTLTREDYRGKGLFTALARRVYEECLAKGITFTIGFPNPSSYPGFTRKLDFAHLGNMPVLFSALRVTGLLRRALGMRGSKKYGADIAIDEAFASPVQGREGVTISRFDPASDTQGYPEFVEAFNRQYAQLTHRSARYLQWRYVDIPTRKYVLLKVTKGERILGFCALRAREIFSLRSVIIVDLCSLHDREAVLGSREMLRVVRRRLRRAGIDIMGVMMNRHAREYSILTSNLFFAVPKRFLPHMAPFIVRTHEPGVGPGVKDMARWFLTFGDYDVM